MLKKRDFLNRLTERLNKNGKHDFSERLKCRHCRAYLNENQKYCTKCGRSVKNPVVKLVDYRSMPVLYGPPPVFADLICTACGEKWSVLKDNPKDRKEEVTYCPRCGLQTVARNFRDIYGS